MTKADKKSGITKKKYRPHPDDPKHLSSKKYKPKKEKKPWVETWYVCPFCDSYLGKIEQDKPHGYIQSVPGKYGHWVDNTKTSCDSCKAFEVHNACPCCKRNTWFKPDDKTLTTGFYKHDNKRGCGFYGRRKDNGMETVEELRKGSC